MIQIRAARPDDIEELSQIGLAAWQKGIMPIVSRDIATKIRSDNPFPGFLKEQGANILVATFENSLVGMGGCEDLDNHISDLWVSPEHEGKGAATALIHALERKIHERGHTQATIESAANNERALSLYLYLGYVEEWRGVREDPILETSLEKVFLRKKLDL